MTRPKPKWALVQYLIDGSKHYSVVKADNVVPNATTRVIGVGDKKAILESNATNLINSSSSSSLKAVKYDNNNHHHFSSLPLVEVSSDDEVQEECGSLKGSKRKASDMNCDMNCVPENKRGPSRTQLLEAEVQQLRDEMKMLKEENKKLLELNWKLQETLPKMIDLLSNKHQESPDRIVPSPTGVRKQLTPATPPQEVFPSEIHQQHQGMMLPRRAFNGGVIDLSTNPCTEGLLAFISKDQLVRACQNTSNYKKIIGNIMEVLFTEGEMLSCSVTGVNTAKRPLDARKSNALIDFVSASFPGVSVTQIRQRMGNKLRDKRQLQHRLTTINMPSDGQMQS